MALLDNLQSILGGGQNQNQSGSTLTNLLAPAALGGLMGALMSNKTTRKATGSVLLVGGGAALATALWNKYKNRPSVQQTVPVVPPQSGHVQPVAAYTSQAQGTVGFNSSNLDARAKRLIRAMIFAAKSDGVIDAQERQAIQETLQQLNLGQEAEQVINQAMNDPLDPKAIAQGVSSREEALEVYLVSSSVIEVDHFMESSYLDALAGELGIPPELTRDIAQEIAKNRQG